MGAGSGAGAAVSEVRRARVFQFLVVAFRGEAMNDAADLSLIAGSALPAAFTFLFQRLQTALERRRSARTEQPEHAPDVPTELVGSLQLPLRIDEDELADHAPVLEALALGLRRYDRDPHLVTAHDADLMQALGKVREGLEHVYGQRFTFQGETRQSSGPLSVQHYDTVTGEVIGMEAGQAILGAATSTIRAGSVEAGGRVVGMKAPIIDGRS
ncbi:hypothetical protein [Streptomyces tendae]|uniref:hypothetical protein n=2 Tax=Streptomyces TaxID=1883 RepID=UPI0036B791C4